MTIELLFQDHIVCSNYEGLRQISKEQKVAEPCGMTMLAARKKNQNTGLIAV